MDVVRMSKAAPTKEFDLDNIRYIRAGLIPTFKMDGGKYYVFGVDSRTRILTDFGGHREHKDRDILDTAMREYMEESHGAFGIPTRDTLYTMLAVDGIDTLEILYDLGHKSRQDLDAMRNTFNKLNTLPGEELSDVTWLSRDQLVSISRSGMYNRVLTAISNNVEYV